MVGMMVAMEGGEGGGLAGEEGAVGRVVEGAMDSAASRAVDLDEVTISVGDEEDGLWGGVEAEVDEVLSRAS